MGTTNPTGEAEGTVTGQQIVHGIHSTGCHLPPTPPSTTGVRPEDIAAYLDSVIADCAPLRLKAINPTAATPGSKPLGLVSVYVELNLDLRIPRDLSLAKYLETTERRAHDLERESATSQNQDRRVPVLEALACHDKLVRLGAPGSGKSTVAAYVALALAEAARGDSSALQRLGNRAKLPEDRADLYNEVVELLLARWNETSGAARGLLDALGIPSLTLSHLRTVIQALAFRAHEAPRPIVVFPSRTSWCIGFSITSVRDEEQTKQSRVARGGSWSDDGPVYLSCGFRDDDQPASRYDDCGFRCVWESGSAR